MSKLLYLRGPLMRELLAVEGQHVLGKEYVRGLDLGGGIGGIIYQKKGSDYYYYHYNHKGDVVALTDGNGKLAAYYEYDAWGNVMTETETSGVDNPVEDPAEGRTTPQTNGTRSRASTTSASATTPTKSEDGRKETRQARRTG